MTSIYDASKQAKDVVEIINTIQGEGPHAGLYMTLIRFKKCNLDCKFKLADGSISCCDTKEKMANPELPLTFEQIANYVRETANLMITGGEPTLYIDEIIELIEYLIQANVHIDTIDIETNGHNLTELAARLEEKKLHFKNLDYTFIWSPKIYEEPLFKLNVSKIPKYLENSNVVLKLVAYDEQLIGRFMDNIPVKDLRKRTYIMPVGETSKEQVANFDLAFKMVGKYQCKFSPRIHLFYMCA